MKFNINITPDIHGGQNVMSVEIQTPYSCDLGNGLSISLKECHLSQNWHSVFTGVKDFIGCTFCLDGSLTTQIQHEPPTIHINKGTSGIWYAPDTLIHVSMKPGHIRWLDIEISFQHFVQLIKDNQHEFCPEFLASLKKNPAKPFHRTGTMDAQTLQSVEQIITCPFHGPLKRIHQKSNCLSLLLKEIRHHALLSSPEQCQGCANCPKMEQAKALLLRDLGKAPTISGLASELGMSESSLKRAFRKSFGMSIYAYFQSHRLRQAKKLLSQGEMNVTEVAFSVGFSNHSHFSRAFKRQFGIPPKNMLSHSENTFS